MTKQNYYEGVKHVVSVCSDVRTHCELCNCSIGGKDDDLAKSINHYINEHEYKLLHVGMETGRDDTGNPWHSSIAFLGR